MFADRIELKVDSRFLMMRLLDFCSSRSLKFHVFFLPSILILRFLDRRMLLVFDQVLTRGGEHFTI